MFLIVSSIALGILVTLAPGFVFCTALVIFLFFIINKSTPEEEKKFVFTAVSVALILRALALIFMHYYCLNKGVFDIFGDAHDNIRQGIEGISNFLLGISPEKTDISLIWRKGYNVHSKTIFNGIFFTVFGKDLYSLKFLNSLAVVVSGLLMYNLTRKIYSFKTAKFALCIIIFWPTLFLWSITDLKDSHFILAITAMLWSFTNILIKKPFWRFFPIFLLSAVYATFMRFSLMVPVLIVVFFFYLLGYIFWILLAGFKRIRAYFVLLVVITVIFYFSINPYPLFLFYTGVMGAHKGFLVSGGWNYDLLGNFDPGYYFTPLFIAQYFITGWFHFLCEPLPWNISSISMLISYPMMLAWYLLLFFAFFGVINLVLRGKLREIYPILIFGLTYITITGMSVANIGTAVRFRDTIMPIIVVLAACSIASEGILKDRRGNG